MGTYYFHLIGAKTISDPDGVELSDVTAARVHALTVARELSANANQFLGHSWSDWTLSVTDESGRRVLSFPMNDIGGSA